MKYRNYSLVALMMMAAFALSSCRDWEDTNQSMALSGEWYGDFGMYYDYVDRFGRHYTFDSYDTRLSFIPAYDYASYGRGTQVDYYAYGPYEYQYYQFRWSVRDGIVYLTYDYDHNLDTYISSYHMTNNIFTGYCEGATTAFRLRKIADFYDWTPYVNAYGYYSRDNWSTGYPYYAPATRGDGASLETAQTDSTGSEGYVMSRGRREDYKN